MMEFSLALALALFLRLTVLHFTVIQGRSMLPTLQNGEWTLVWRWSLHFAGPKRGDVVICFFPGRKMKRLPFLRQPMVKRVIGLPGETIQIREGMIYIDGQLYLETKNFPVMTNPGMAAEPMTLGDTQYFVLGDMRESSIDSRNTLIGCVARDQIVGKVFFRIWPLKTMRFFRR